MKNVMFRNCLIMLLTFLLNSVILNFLPNYFMKSGIIYIPSFELVVFTLLIKTFRDNYERFFFGALCGFYYAIVYGDSLMIYVLIYLAITFVRTFIYANDHINLLEFLVFIALTITGKELILFVLMKSTQVTNMSLFWFIIQRFIPTLLITSIGSLLFFGLYHLLDFDLEEDSYN